MLSIKIWIVAALVCFLGSHGFKTSFSASLRQRRNLNRSYSAVSGAYTTVRSKIGDAIRSANPSKKVSNEQMESIGRFMDEYVSSGEEANLPAEVTQQIVTNFLKSLREALVNPYQFKAFHSAIREPFDYYKWGNDFMRTLIIQEQSCTLGVEQLGRIQAQLERGENVVLLSNHQTEADPQVVSIMLEQNGFASLAEKIIFVAGHKVTNDPVAIPFSMGRNLLCIHSKKHIKNPPEDVGRKQAQNLQSMKAMGDLAAEGGKIFWVAPSGGRDRPDPETGKFVVAPFDSKALDMFKLIAIQSHKPMHFYPLAMYTHQLIPPPASVSSTLGEERSAKRGAVSIHILDETDGIGGLKDSEFKEKLEATVESAYQELSKWHEKR